jgi:maltose/maltodextrin transport system substrate-binding protein/arabinogalactan oligomer/maltooligosaccharide transport system substrate-binding protein
LTGRFAGGIFHLESAILRKQSNLFYEENHMKASTKFLILALALLMTVMVVGSVAAQDASAETPEPTATFVPAQEGTLTIWADEQRIPPLTTLGESFTEQYGVPIQIQQMGFGDVRNNLILGGPAGEGPDIIVGAHDWLGQLSANGLLSPIELPEDVAANFNPVALQAFTYDGQLLGVPYAIEAIAVYYNTDIVEEVPATWEELTALAEQVVADGKAERGLAIPNSTGDPYHHYPLFTGFGAYVFGRDAEGSYNPEDVGLDNEGGVKAMQEIDRLVKADVLNAAVDYGAAQSLFQDGKLAMWITGPWALGDLRSSGVPFGVAPIPTMEETPRPFSGVQGFMINSFSPNLLLAQAFLTEFVATDEGMQLLYEADPRTPVWTPLVETLDNPELKAFAEAAANADPMPAIPQMSAVWNAWGNAVNLIYQQQADPETAIQDAAQAIRDEIAKGSGS